jgi:hypothetical protein
MKDCRSALPIAGALPTSAGSGSLASGGGADGIREQIQQALPQLQADSPVIRIGVGFGGPVNWLEGKICRSHQVEGWSGFDLGGWIRQISSAATGSLVRKDEILASYYSPEILGPQQAHLYALEALDRFVDSKNGSAEQLELNRKNKVTFLFSTHPSAVDRIEMIRGAQSAVYGSYANSGVVDFGDDNGGRRRALATLRARNPAVP